VFTTDELIQFFEISDINNSPAAVNPDKLLWLNQHYIKNGDPVKTETEFAYHLQKLGIQTQRGPALGDVIKAQAERTKTLKEMAERSRYFYEDVVLSEEMRAHITPDVKALLKTVHDRFADIQTFASSFDPLYRWSKEAIHEVIAKTAEEAGLKIGKLAQPLRILMTGGTVSPPIDITIQLIGQKRALARLKPYMIE
jgi:glutamyl-tRNA synthetase